MSDDEKFVDEVEELIDESAPRKGHEIPSLINTINNNRVSFAFLIIGFTLIGLGVFYLKSQGANRDGRVVVLDEGVDPDSNKSVIFVEIAGAVKAPGVYEFSSGARVEDLLVISGGFTDDTDLSWVERFVNRASILSDGQKLYIPKKDEQLGGSSANSGTLYQSDTLILGSQGSTIVNINTATQSELEQLWGIGPVYAQNIIEHRPYSSLEELLEKGVIKNNVYEKNKVLMTVY